MSKRAKWGPENPQWKGDAARSTTKRRRARKIYPLGPCERCGKPGTDRHHKDADTGNNTPDNIAILCRRCHMEEDGRLDRFHEMAVRKREVLPPSPCLNCGQLAKPLRKGRCGACEAYWRRRGSERPYAEDGRTERHGDSSTPCERCGRPRDWGSKGAKGLCGSCYQLAWRGIG
jgi:hypothetical protein